jgi:hypothetical protein
MSKIPSDTQWADLVYRIKEKANSSDLPTKVSDLTNDSGYQTASDVSSAISSAVSSVMTYKGTVATVADLPASGNKVGDVYNVTATGGNYAWDGTSWDELGSTVDLSNYYTKSQTDTALAAKADASTTYTKTEVDTALGAKANSADVYTKAQTDSAISTATADANKIEYVTCTLSSATTTGFNATTDKTATDVKALVAAGKKVSYRCTITTTAGSLLAGTYDFTVLYTGANTSTDIVTGYAVSIPYGGSGLTNYIFTHSGSTVNVMAIQSPTKVSDLTNDSGFQTASDVSTAIAGKADSSSLATVATSGSYNDLSNKPTIPAAQIQSDWAQTTTTAKDYIKNKPALATVATSGSYNDLSNKPTIPDTFSNSEWNALWA